MTFLPQSQKPTAASVQPRTTGRFAPDAVEHAPADLRGHDEPEEEIEQHEARGRRRLAQRELRVLAREEEDRDEHEVRGPEHEVLDEERADAEDPHVDQRRLRPPLEEEEDDEQRRADDDERDRAGIGPAPRRRLLEPGDAQRDPVASTTRPR